MHENRETSEVPEVNTHDRPVGEGNSRTAHVHASEESDSGVVPMNQFLHDFHIFKLARRHSGSVQSRSGESRCQRTGGVVY